MAGQAQGMQTIEKHEFKEELDNNLSLVPGLTELGAPVPESEDQL